MQIRFDIRGFLVLAPKAFLVVAALLLLPGAAAPVSGQEFDFDKYETNTLAVSGDLFSMGRLGGVAADRAGELYVSNFGSKVWKVSIDGKMRLLAEGLYGASGNAVTANGDLLQANFFNHTIVRIDGQGVVHPFVDKGLSGPVGIAINKSGEVFVVNCNGRNVSRITGEGVAEPILDDDRLACPNGLTFDRDDNLYVVNFSNTIVLKISPDGDVSEVASLPGNGNSHIAFVGGSLWITQIHTHNLFRLELDGSYERVAGTGERGFGDGPTGASTLSFPNGIAVNARDGALYFNTLKGFRGGSERTSMVIRRLYPNSYARTLKKALEEGGVSRLQKAHEAFMKLPDTDPNGWFRRTGALGQELLQRGHAEAGLFLVGAVAKAFPQSTQALIGYANAHAMFGSRTKALELYRKALELAPDDSSLMKRIEDVEEYRSDR